jgi:hypothetical protein
MKTYSLPLKNFCISILLLITYSVIQAQQIDTTFIKNVSVKPDIDGVGSDECWATATWYPIDQVWINYGEQIDAADFSGRFKTVWSSQENLLYFLVEITDDIAIGGFIEGQTADVYNYDITEVFLDENRSGGPHIFDNDGTGENAENAFAYHIYADFPTGSSTTTEIWVGDIPIPYTEHIGDFAMRSSGNLYTREFSVKVYGEDYEDADPEASRITLTPGKIMGLSLAYCDNDENDGTRDNFFGSVWVPEPNYNNHWMNADDFGPARLVSDISVPVEHTAIDNRLIQVFPNPAKDLITIRSATAIEYCELYTIDGNLVFKTRNGGTQTTSLNVNEYLKGTYILHVVMGNGLDYSKKLILQ